MKIRVFINDSDSPELPSFDCGSVPSPGDRLIAYASMRREVYNARIVRREFVILHGMGTPVLFIEGPSCFADRVESALGESFRRGEVVRAVLAVSVGRHFTDDEVVEASDEDQPPTLKVVGIVLRLMASHDLVREIDSHVWTLTSKATELR